jgi:hypothetical protein
VNIDAKKKVRKAIGIVKNAHLKTVKVEMSRYPDYKFQFPSKSSKSHEAKIASYSLWVNAKGKKLEIVNDSDRFVQLTTKDSEILYEILQEKSQ